MATMLLLAGAGAATMSYLMDSVPTEDRCKDGGKVFDDIFTRGGRHYVRGADIGWAERSFGHHRLNSTRLPPVKFRQAYRGRFHAPPLNTEEYSRAVEESVINTRYSTQHRILDPIRNRANQSARAKRVHLI